MKSPFTGSMLSLRLNSFWLLFTRISALGLAVVFIALVARRLEPASFGQFTFIAATVFIGNTFTSFGTDTLLIREIARAGQITALVARAFTLQIILSAIWCSATLILRMDTPLVIFSLSLFPLAIFSIVSTLLRAFERMDLFWGLNLINGLVQILAAIFSSDLLTLCTLLLIGNILDFFLCLTDLFRFMMPASACCRLLTFVRFCALVLPFAALATLSALSQRLGVLSISVLVGDAATGLFSSAARIVDAMKFGHYAMLGALLPALSRGALHSKQNYQKAFAALLGLSILLAGTITFLAHPLLNFLFGEKYIPATNLLIVLVWSLVPYTISAFLSVQLVVLGKESALLRTVTTSLAVSIILFIWLIKQYGLAGAVWAALISEIIQATIFMLATLKNQKII